MEEIKILIIGQGIFGTYITENIIKPLGFHIIDILRSKDFNKINYYATHQELYNCVYIALPYELHNPVIRMFPPNTPILCEKPILGYDLLPNIRMGYHRYFDTHFINAKLTIQKLLFEGKTPRIRIVSKDTGASDNDSLEWLYCAMCHDLHMAIFLLDNIKVIDVRIGKNPSEIFVDLEGRKCKVTIEYARDSSTYIQEVIVDNIVFGYDSEVFSETYEETYKREFFEFANHPKPDDLMLDLQKKTSDLLLCCAKIICSKNKNALNIHLNKYSGENWNSETTKSLLSNNKFVLPFEPIELQ
ncbi:hypothetical protein KM1_118860 [Entamoeba histolytica HM-3:IMSS]|uniref:Uncharacterized protein n=1 Tax=Entamoeba histolytica HM-3:IMSS TaxID=885315 RepID=M7WAZ6_ENTHI|nr:hypothetical protein KM1_118860 [Entamoeba histolytica HM-3:IMSS]